VIAFFVAMRSALRSLTSLSNSQSPLPTPQSYKVAVRYSVSSALVALLIYPLVWIPALIIAFFLGLGGCDIKTGRCIAIMNTFLTANKIIVILFIAIWTIGVLQAFLAARKVNERKQKRWPLFIPLLIPLAFVPLAFGEFFLNDHIDAAPAPLASTGIDTYTTANVGDIVTLGGWTDKDMLISALVGPNYNAKRDWNTIIALDSVVWATAKIQPMTNSHAGYHWTASFPGVKVPGKYRILIYDSSHALVSELDETIAGF
jgi:hypothetical protein